MLILKICTMKTLADDYRKRVWRFISRMKPEAKYTVNVLYVEFYPVDKQRFIAEIKAYMDAFRWQGWITFNHDYSKIYRINPLPIEALQEYKSNLTI